MYSEHMQISRYLENHAQPNHVNTSPLQSRVITSPPPPSLVQHSHFMGLSPASPGHVTAGGISNAAALPPSSRGRKKGNVPLDPSKAVNCSECMKQFSHDFHLKIHMRCHTGERPFECSVCLKRFTQKGNLDTHMRKHTGDRPFKCEVCNKCFTQKGNMETHMRLHTGEKPFQCMLCQKRFYQQGGLKNHKCANDPGGTVSSSISRSSTERRGRKPAAAHVNTPSPDIPPTMLIPKQEPVPYNSAESVMQAGGGGPDRNWYHLEGRPVFSDMFIKRETVAVNENGGGYHHQ